MLTIYKSLVFILNVHNKKKYTLYLNSAFLGLKVALQYTAVLGEWRTKKEGQTKTMRGVGALNRQRGEEISLRLD